MNIIESTRSYERWLGDRVDIVGDDLKYKHAQMAAVGNPFPFFRGTFYRWLQLWKEQCPELDRAPACNAVGDLHIENFGTWRDRDGRLIWGVNDFDEADDYPYTADLVRLAASAGIARSVDSLRTSLTKICRAIEYGYRKNLKRGGKPIVLEEKNRFLRRLAHNQEREPTRYWKRMTAVLDDEPVFPSKELKELLKASAPEQLTGVEFRRRPRVGMGSLGKPRFVMLARWHGGWIEREAKALTPSAKVWYDGGDPPANPRAQEILSASIRCPDPVLHYGPEFVCRRLAPQCGRIELSNIAEADEEIRLLAAMGQEAANIHLGSGKKVAEIKKHLAKLPADWLAEAARKMVGAVVADWRAFRSRRKVPAR